MKDDYKAKYKIWANEDKVFPLPKMTLPFKFSAKKFSSYKEMNEWKSELIKKIGEYGGVKWSK